MKPEQAAGYLFESEIMELLRESSFVNVETKTLEGRGTKHQIDAYGVYSFPVPFTYPIRLIAEAKCYENKIELPLIRSFFGVITDISENYFVRKGETELKSRFLDTGCFFAANSFTKPSQDFAWAHNIFLVSFSGIWQMKAIINNIKNFLREPAIKGLHFNKEELIIHYTMWKSDRTHTHERNKPEYPSIVFAIIDNVIPVVLVGNHGWHKRIQIPPNTDKVRGTKNFRKPLNGNILFEIDIPNKNLSLETIYFTLPNRIAKKITGRIDESEPGMKVFDLDIPLVSWNKGQSVRRIIKIEVNLPEKRENQSPKKVNIKTESKSQKSKIGSEFDYELEIL